MAEPRKQPENSGGVGHQDEKRAPMGVQPRVVHPHKGDVGRTGTNEEVFQGSKQKELND